MHVCMCLYVSLETYALRRLLNHAHACVLKFKLVLSSASNAVILLPGAGGASSDMTSENSIEDLKEQQEQAMHIAKSQEPRNLTVCVILIVNYSRDKQKRTQPYDLEP